MCAVVHETQPMLGWEERELLYKLLELTVSLFQSQNHITNTSGLTLHFTFCHVQLNHDG